MFYIDDFILDSPFYIFIRDSNSVGVAGIIDILDLKCQQITQEEEQADEYGNNIFYTTTQDEWVHIMDSYSYNLWHMSILRDRLHELGRNVDALFWGSVGDSDHSFDFIYYKNGKLVRKYIVEDPTYQKGIVTENIGSPLEGESNALLQEDERDKVLEIAKLLGIKLKHKKENIICFRCNSDID